MTIKKTHGNNKLAILGGKSIISREFSFYNPIGEEEVKAATDVIRSGKLSGYIASWGDDFLGGEKVKEFEAQCCSYFGVKHAITVNSWTSGLIAAVGAIGVEPGDEIIVPPWTMCASATAILHWNAIPVFADIDPVTYCISPASVEKNISSRTRGIMSVDIGGHPADTDALNAIAQRHNLKVISDCAQSPGAMYKKRKAGTLTDIGGYSLNYHKHIHTGEGGILVTDNDDLALRMRLIRNHAEACIESSSHEDLSNMIGHNFRLGEIECAMGIEQLKKLDKAILTRQTAAKELIRRLGQLKGLKVPQTNEDCTHVYYMFFMQIDSSLTGVSRDLILAALKAEGVPSLSSRFSNVHLLPVFQKKIAYGNKGFPWTSELTSRFVSYEKGICPVAESLHDYTYIGFQMCMHDCTPTEIELICCAFEKVWSNLDALAEYGSKSFRV